LTYSPEAVIHSPAENDRSMTDDGDEVTVAACLDPDDIEAILGALVGDALNQTGEHMSVWG
jgi:hypothetical protein